MILFLIQVVFAQQKPNLVIDDIEIKGQVQKPEIFISKKGRYFKGIRAWVGSPLFLRF